MKKVSKVLTVLLALAMVLSLSVTAFAANGAYEADDNDYGTIPGTTTTLTKYLVVDNDAEIPAAEFQFTVTAGGTAAEATETTVPVFAGVTPEEVKVNNVKETGKVTFTAGETTTAGAASDGIADSTDRKYASKDITLDFSGVAFDKPGVYRYTITEADPSSPFAAVGSKITTVDVYIQDNNGTLAVQGYVAYDGEVTNAPSSTADTATGKDSKFVNEEKTYDLKVDKIITGNQGDKEDEFDFTITIENAGSGTIINTGTVDTGKNNVTGVNPGTTKYTADGSGKIEVKVKLGHNDQLVLTGIPEGATYTVTEDSSTSGKTSDGYTVTGEVTTAKTLTADASETVTNTRNGVLPTGVLMAASTGIVILAIGIGGFILMGRKRREEE